MPIRKSKEHFNFPGRCAVWLVSQKWFNHQHDCTLNGITERCHGSCCNTVGFWPPAAYGGVCGHLNESGCDLLQKNKPVTCLLYPTKLSKTGKLVLHNRCTTGKGVCKGNFKQGPLLIDALSVNLIVLFGEEQFDRVRQDVVEKKKDSYFNVPQWVIDRLAQEADCGKHNKQWLAPAK